MVFFRQFILATIAVIGFAGYFNVKGKKVLVGACISGGFSFAIFSHFSQLDQVVFGTFVAALLIGLIGEFLSVRLKAPSTVFITPGIIPLVPGAGMYYTMLDFVNEDFQSMISTGANTIFIAGSIAMGILVASIFSRSLQRMRRHNFK